MAELGLGVLERRHDYRDCLLRISCCRTQDRLVDHVDCERGGILGSGIDKG